MHWKGNNEASLGEPGSPGTVFVSRKDTASSRGVCEDPKVADEN